MQHALDLGSCRSLISNYDLCEAAIQRVDSRLPCKECPVCVGMLESGIGRAHNIAMSTLPGFTLPGDVSASERYWTADIIEPAVTVTPQGTIKVPTEPGLGFAVNLERIESLTVRRAKIKSNTSVSA